MSKGGSKSWISFASRRTRRSFDRLHRLARPRRIARAADDRPALRQRIDLAFRIRLRAERFAIVEIGAPIPLAVPGVFLDVFLQCFASARQRSAKGDVLARARQLGKLREHIVKKKGQPDAFAAAFFSDQVHAVIPIAGADQRQAVLAKFQAVLDRAHAMLVERGRFLGAIRQIVIRFLFRHDRPGVEKRNLFIEHAGIRDAGDVAAGDVGQPEIVVGKMRAHAAARRRMPPMLHIAFAELMRGGAEQMLAGQGRLGVHQRHHILQLIAEAIRTAGLIKAGAPPEPAAKRLVNSQPLAIDVHGGIWRIDVDRAEGAIPKFVHAGERDAAGVGPAKTLDQIRALRRCCDRPRAENWFRVPAHRPDRKRPASHRTDPDRRPLFRKVARASVPPAARAFRCAREIPSDLR